VLRELAKDVTMKNASLPSKAVESAKRLLASRAFHRN
jgi:hypothetical protein